MSQVINYPAVSDIVDALVEVFNERAVGLNLYSEHELRIHPINGQDIYERNHGKRGRSPRLIDECRLMTYLVASRYTQVWDPLAQAHGFLEYGAIGRCIGDRSARAVMFGCRSACEMLADGSYRYMLDQGLRLIKSRGFTIWNEPRALSDNPCDPS